MRLCLILLYHADVVSELIVGSTLLLAALALSSSAFWVSMRGKLI